MKPNTSDAMRNIITEVKQVFPFDAPQSRICGDTCVGCPKKLLELVETEIDYWQFQLDKGEVPTFDELNRFGKLCKNVKRGLVRNGILEK